MKADLILRVLGSLERADVEFKVIGGVVAEDLCGEYPAVQYVPPEEGFHIDILTRLGEMYGWDDIETDRHAVEDIEFEVATPEMLYRMKRGTIRPQDHADAARLRATFGLAD